MKSTRCILSIILGLLAGWLPLGAATVLKNLQVEYQTNPLGIDVSQPRFNWQMESDRYGACGQAYRLWVADSPEQLAAGRYIYDSGKVLSGESVGVVYQGKALQPSTRYYWKVSVWDESGTEITSTEPAWFETGLLGSGWSGARWIGSSETQLSKYRSHYVIDYDVRVAEGNDKAVFVFGARDADNYVSAELDLNGSGDARFILRHTTDGKTRQDAAESLASIIPASDKHKAHHIRLKVTTAQYALKYFVDIEIDGKTLENSSLTPEEKERKSRGDFWGGKEGAFTVYPYPDGELVYHCRLYAIGFLQSKGQTATFSNLRISEDTWNTLLYNPPETYVEKGEGKLNVWYPGESVSAPMLRKAIKIEKPVKSARLYATARGVYEFSVNGQKVGKDYLNPGWTDYRYRIMYNTYDITDLLRPGDNGIGAMLGAGWWSEHSGFLTGWQDQYGTRQSLLGKIVIEYADGTRETIVTNDSWKCYDRGPITFNGLQNGEEYDARKEVNGWDAPGFDDSSWNPATLFAAPPVNVEIQGYVGSPIQNNVTLTAQSMVEPIPGVYVYDMGQNMVGVPRISLSGMKPGTEITLRFAEVKYPDLPEYEGNIGMIMLENIRAAMAQDVYIAKGGQETISPRFTYHGYRFIEITGIDKQLPVGAVKGVVLSSIHELASRYETSNTQVNQLWKNITWSSYGNFLSIPTDCPQRNERLGWAGDISVFSRTATYLADVPQFLRRYLRSMRDVQRTDGRFPDIAPLGGGFGGLLWGSAGITVPWECYQQYGDTILLSEHYDAMKRYIQYIIDNTIETETNLIVQTRSWGDLCDWLGLEDEKNDKSLVWEAYFIYDLELMAKMATALGKAADAEWFRELHAARKDFFNKTYIEPETGKTLFSAFVPEKKGSHIDIQTSYVLPLAFNIIDEENRNKVIANLAETVKRENTTDRGQQCPSYSLMTGFIGTSWINKALSDYGHSDLAYRLLQQTSYPSWLYSIEQGATTIWERLNSYTRTDGFGGNNRMNSFNHYSFGAVGAWMYNYSLGIQRDETSPGFKQFVLKPMPDPTGKMTYARGYYDSMYGRIESGWKVESGVIRYTFTVPANTTATLYLPAASLRDVREKTKSVRKCKGIEFISEGNGEVVLKLLSGSYSFEVKRDCPLAARKRKKYVFVR